MKKKILKNLFLTLILGLSVGTALNAQECTLVVNENFNQYAGGLRNYNESMVRNDFGSIGTPKGLNGRTKVGNGQIRALFPKDKILGGQTGFTWFDKLESDATDEAVMEYKMKFSNGFQFTLGGKLPGLSGGTAPRGCNADKTGGFSARQMWQRRGQMISYLYWPESDFRCGSTWYWLDENGDNLTMDTNRWYKIRQHIKLNTPGVRNGILEVFVDDVVVFRKTNIMYRETGDTFKIDNAYWTTYVGGSTQNFAPTQNQYIWFDDFKVWVNCSVPPGSNTNQAPVVNVTSPANGAEFELGEEITLSASASDPDGNLDKINFKINNAYYSTDNTRPFQTSFVPTEPGTYKIAARAFDLDNAHTETFVTVTVRAQNSAPIVAITSPANGAAFELGEEIPLSASATDPDGNLDRINFKINNAYYSTDNSRPFRSTFTPTEPGTYKIAARAFDLDNVHTEVFVNVIVRAQNSGARSSIRPPLDEPVFKVDQETAPRFDNLDQDVNFDTTATFETTLRPTETSRYKNSARAFDWDGSRSEVFLNTALRTPLSIDNDFEDIDPFSSVKAYPIPADRVLNIVGITNNSEVSIYDITGKIVKNITYDTSSVQIDVSTFTEGSYFLTIKNGDERKTIRFIKK